MRTGLESQRRLELVSEMENSNINLSTVTWAITGSHNGSYMEKGSCLFCPHFKEITEF